MSLPEHPLDVYHFFGREKVGTAVEVRLELTPLPRSS